MSEPELSVIVTVVDGGETLEHCLTALSRQADPPVLEVIVPYDESIAEVADLAGRFPAFRFLALGSLLAEPARDEYERHVLYDRRRSGGLAEARGHLVAMVEDRGRPRPGWARAMADLHASGTYAAIGGAVENEAPGELRWAIFFCDFGRYQPPLQDQSPDYLTDINICYSRSALEEVRDLWEHRYQEAVVNWALRDRGKTLLLSDRPVVAQDRAPVTLGRALRERVDWGRTFGEVRGRDAKALTCFFWAAATPLLPVLLFLRHFRRQLRKKHSVREFLEASPAILLLLHFWALGEGLGYCRAGLEAMKSR